MWRRWGRRGFDRWPWRKRRKRNSDDLFLVTIYDYFSNKSITLSSLHDRESVWQFDGTSWISEITQGTASYSNYAATSSFVTGSMVSAITYSETSVTCSISSNILTLPLNTGNEFIVSMSANVTTCNFNNVPAGTYGFILYLVATGTAYSFAWPSPSVKWYPNDVAPTLTTTSGQTDTFVFVTYNGGTTWFGFVGGQNA